MILDIWKLRVTISLLLVFLYIYIYINKGPYRINSSRHISFSVRPVIPKNDMKHIFVIILNFMQQLRIQLMIKFQGLQRNLPVYLRAEQQRQKVTVYIHCFPFQVEQSVVVVIHQTTQGLAPTSSTTIGHISYLLLKILTIIYIYKMKELEENGNE